MGLSLISFSGLPCPHRIRQPCLVEDRHRVGTSSQKGRGCDSATGSGSDALGNDRLTCRDVVGGDVLHGDLLLAPTSVVVEPFRQHYDGAGGLVR